MGEVDEDGSEDIDTLHFENTLRGAGVGAFFGRAGLGSYRFVLIAGRGGGARAFFGAAGLGSSLRSSTAWLVFFRIALFGRAPKTPARPHPLPCLVWSRIVLLRGRPKTPPPPLRAKRFQNAKSLYLPSHLHPPRPPMLRGASWRPNAERWNGNGAQRIRTAPNRPERIRERMHGRENRGAQNADFQTDTGRATGRTDSGKGWPRQWYPRGRQPFPRLTSAFLRWSHRGAWQPAERPEPRHG